MGRLLRRLSAHTGADRRCERMDITGLTDITEARRALLALGAVDQQAGPAGSKPGSYS